MPVWDKLDAGLASLYMDYLHAQERGSAPLHAHEVVAEGKELRLTLLYSGELAPIEALGFRTISAETPGRANGAIDLADLERLAEHPNVVKLTYGQKPRMWLDQSVPDIRVRGTVWNVSGMNLTGNTGKDVIIGIIDSGIDIEHPYFLSGPKTSRILRIWDPGLHADPKLGESAPPAGRVAGTPYGVEYKQEDISAALDDKKTVRHRDCGGHGTHVASIAAGNGGEKHTFAGVAPEAGLIIVKTFDLEDDPRDHGLDNTQFFADCVNYILKTAAADFPKNKGVVINASWGLSTGPHDGFTANEDFLTYTFDPARAKGQVFVTAAGNAGYKSQHARIELTSSPIGVSIPFDVYDPRTEREDYDSCQWADTTGSLKLDVFYPDDGTPPLAFQFDLPDDGMGWIDGPAFGATAEGSFGTRRYKVFHKQDDGVLTTTGRPTAKRRHFQLLLNPDNKQMHRVTKKDGAIDYQLKIVAQSNITAHLWCEQAGGYGIRLNSLAEDNSTVFVNTENRYLIGSNGGAKNVITVGAYNSEAPDRGLYPGSSRGPLVNYGGTPAPPPQPPKPDIAAPGVKIKAAHSHFVRPKNKVEAEELGGTSQSAPHITGVVALMLQQKQGLTVDDILNVFKANPGSYSGASALNADDAGAGRIDGNLAVTKTT